MIGADDAGSGRKGSEAIRRFQARFLAQVKSAMAHESLAMTTWLKSERLRGGTTAEKLRVRTGQLRAATRPAPVAERPGGVEGGILFGTRYAATHIGPAGTVTTIRPVRRRFLAIPLPAALTPAGVLKGAPRSGVWGQTFIKDGIIYGKRVAQRGAFAGTAKGKIVPLFVLKRQVKVPVRVSVEEITRRFWERFSKSMKGKGA